MDVLTQVATLKRNLARLQKSKASMLEKAKRHANDATVEEFTTRDIKRLDQAIYNIQAELSAIRAAL